MSILSSGTRSTMPRSSDIARRLVATPIVTCAAAHSGHRPFASLPSRGNCHDPLRRRLPPCRLRGPGRAGASSPGRGWSIDYLDAGIDALDGTAAREADLLVLLGAPVGVPETDAYPFLLDELDVLHHRLGAGLPVLGICLGAQLIAAALGASVDATGRKEIGYAPLTLTPEGRNSPLSPLDGLPVLHWHGDEFCIPDGAERLAETPGFPNQAFRIGATVLGLQFHLEADPTVIERWLIGHAAEIAAAGIDPRRIRADAARFGDMLAVSAAEVIGSWLDGLPASRR